MQQTALHILTPAQSRGARALLDWKRELLAFKSGISRETIKKFECERSEISRSSLLRLSATFMDHGVYFIGHDGIQLAQDFSDIIELIKMSPNEAPKLSARQLVAARAMLNWSQSDLSSAADVSVSAIANFEKQFSVTSALIMKKLAQTLLESGINFANDGGVFLTPTTSAPVLHDLSVAQCGAAL